MGFLLSELNKVKLIEKVLQAELKEKFKHTGSDQQSTENFCERSDSAQRKVEVPTKDDSNFIKKTPKLEKYKFEIGSIGLIPTDEDEDSNPKKHVIEEDEESLPNNGEIEEDDDSIPTNSVIDEDEESVPNNDTMKGETDYKPTKDEIEEDEDEQMKPTMCRKFEDRVILQFSLSELQMLSQLGLVELFEKVSNTGYCLKRRLIRKNRQYYPKNSRELQIY